jgi:hypothetical protein
LILNNNHFFLLQNTELVTLSILTDKKFETTQNSKRFSSFFYLKARDGKRERERGREKESGRERFSFFQVFRND